MKPRTFNSVMHYVNEDWAAKVLRMQINENNGPDLVDDKKIVEVKFKLIYPAKYTHISWRALEYQLNYPAESGKQGYWAVGTYEFNKPVSQVREKDKEHLEGLVNKRELWVVDWDWMNQFQSYHQTGKTEFSEWDNTLRFAKKNKLPVTCASYFVDKGLVHFTEGVNPEEFGF